MNEIDKAREAATVQCEHEWLRSYLIPRCHKCGHTEATIRCLNQGIRQGFDAGYATATAKIEALEAKLATAERLRQTMRANLFAIYNGTWTSSGCPTLAAFADSCLEHVDNELQKENTDA